VTDVRQPIDAALEAVPRPDAAWLAGSVLHVTHWHPARLYAVEIQVR
jgi:hypothetical protein